MNLARIVEAMGISNLGVMEGLWCRPSKLSDGDTCQPEAVTQRTGNQTLEAGVLQSPGWHLIDHPPTNTAPLLVAHAPREFERPGETSGLPPKAKAA